jgi:manganese-dependent inorganic pyrophosphatase
MDAIYITGHRNPDMDSVCSAWAYARLKNELDTVNSYLPISCGHLNEQTKALFQDLGLEAPRLVRDIHPRVGDILQAPVDSLSVSDSILNAVRTLHDRTLSILPVFREGDFAGLVSVQEISDFLISEQIGGRPHYTFRVENFGKVLPGKLLRGAGEDEFKAPLMVGAMPFEQSIARIRELLPSKPVLVVGKRSKIIRYAVENAFPALVLTGIEENEDIREELDGYEGTVFLSHTDTAETARLLRLSAPVEDIMGCDYPTLTEDTHFDEAKGSLINSEYRGLPVFSDGSFRGIVTRRSFIDKPKRKLIMMDHNEAAQSIRGIEHAEIVEIIDHHRFAPEKTRSPIYIAAKPVGSTCTIVYQHYITHQVPVDRSCALILLSGILSDTVLLNSPTTTGEDKMAVEQLASIAGVDYHTFGEQMFKRTSLISEKDPDDVVSGDFKVYQEYGKRVGIGQVEVVTLEDLPDSCDALKAALKRAREKQRLDWVMLLVSNVLKENSKLITYGGEGLSSRLIYRQEGEGLFDLPDILSRKKQLLPEVLRVLEDAALPGSDLSGE